ncbi:zinc finger domain-containing protein [Amycolatopsis methanolica]|uniref:DNA-binding phage zinc finger domain-containing protein n=1 Tax=Amycolatopsis methanolica 239 TaxID=1068978 RepID=A0A076MYU7_AMYME|nr:hypothetical protein [Amycolatopsis methanolica]AIJ26379.1 hypothetical protein AMETH_6287 [Amycolatopsis methanolica 239]AIJ26438.1 hypothetical protein AMETH_6346 [Amycolatopsis methanolica 239]
MSRYTAGELRRLDELGNFLMTREDAETTDCPRCNAQPGKTCTNVITGEPLRGPAHHQRIAKAERQEGRDSERWTP